MTLDEAKQNIIDALYEALDVCLGDGDLNWKMTLDISLMKDTVEGWYTKEEADDEDYTKRQHS